jgi:hypothetical protein
MKKLFFHAAQLYKFIITSIDDNLTSAMDEYFSGI